MWFRNLQSYLIHQQYLIVVMVFFMSQNTFLKKNSHFSLLSPVIIIYFLHQFHLYLNNKFLLILNILF